MSAGKGKSSDLVGLTVFGLAGGALVAIACLDPRDEAFPAGRAVVVSAGLSFAFCALGAFASRWPAGSLLHAGGRASVCLGLCALFGVPLLIALGNDRWPWLVASSVVLAALAVGRSPPAEPRRRTWRRMGLTALVCMALVWPIWSLFGAEVRWPLLAFTITALSLAALWGRPVFSARSGSGSALRIAAVLGAVLLAGAVWLLRPTPKADAEAGFPSVRLELADSVIRPGERVHLRFDRPLRTAAGYHYRVCIVEAGAPSHDWGLFQYVEAGMTRVVLAGPKRAGDFEVRLQPSMHRILASLPLKVSLLPGEFDPGQVEAEPPAGE